MAPINTGKLDQASVNTTSSNETLLNYFSSDVIVVGAGVSGLTVANELNVSGVEVSVFEKARGTGGRLGSKRVTVDSATLSSENKNTEDSNASFDLGASSFQASTTEFKRFLQELMLQGVVSKTNEPGDSDNSSDHYVAVPRNSMLTRHMSRNLDVTFSKKISKIERKDGKWYLFAVPQTDTRQPQAAQEPLAEEIIASCRHLVISAPAEQSHALLPSEHAALSWLRNIHSDPVFVSTIMLKPNLISDAHLKALKQFSNNVIDNISIEHTKAERKLNSYQIIKLTSTVEWSNKHLNQELSCITDELKQEFTQLLSTLGLSEVAILKQYTHRWLYSQYSQLIKSTKGYLSFSDNLHLVGDYFDVANDSVIQAGEKIKGVERAYMSGQRLVTHLIETGVLNKHIAHHSHAESL